MKPKIKKMILSAAILCIAAVVGIPYFFFSSANEWQSLSSVQKYEGILDQPITQITLRQTVDSAEWAVLEDEDLIGQWSDFLKNAKVKRESGPLDATPMAGGGGQVADIETEISAFSLCFQQSSGKYQLKIDNHVYTIDDDVSIPFDETFKVAVERHGTRSPWD